MNAARDLPKLVAGLAIVALALLPTAGLPAFYDSFVYLVFFWVSLSTSWALLSGFAGYFSLGHAAFFGVGMYTTATLTTKFGVPFLLTIPAATVASRFGYAFIEPSGGAPQVFALHLHNLFLAQPAPIVSSGDAFADYIVSLPAAQRPATPTSVVASS